MNTYRIRYTTGNSGIKLVRADSVTGFDTPWDTTYVFKRENEVVAAHPQGGSDIRRER